MRRSVQRTIMTAIEAFCGEKVKVQGAGRTDAGVHALGQVAHVDLAKRLRETDTIRDALNAHLRPHPVAVLSAEKVAAGFRRAPLGGAAALSLSHRQPPRPISRSTAAAPGGCRAGSTPTAMHAAAQRLVGKHDFTTFRSTECQAKSPEKTLDRLDVSRAGDEMHVSAVGALVPAQPGALDGRLAGAGRRRQVERRRSRRRARRPRPRRLRPGGAAGRALSGAGWIIERHTHAADAAGVNPRDKYRREFAGTTAVSV